MALAQLKMTHMHAETASEIRLMAVRMARDDGATWEAIGGALGMSRQTAHKRFGGLIDDLGDGFD
jgi:hypothetical protein